MESYYAFVLGYDLLQDKLKGLPCDIAYELCTKLYCCFTHDPCFYNLKVSEYEALQMYVNEHKEILDCVIETQKGEWM